MRLSSTLFLLATLPLLAVGCVLPDPDPDFEPVSNDPAPPSSVRLPEEGSGDGSGGTTFARPDTDEPSGNGNGNAGGEVASGDALAEVVYVFMRGHDDSRWMCTGTLIAKDVVVTAAHCLDTKEFASYEIVAPRAPGAPRVSARAPKTFGGDYNDVAQPDIGVLKLDQPVLLPAYAVLTDIVSRVEAGEALNGVAIIRETEEPMSPLRTSSELPLSSSVEYGYEHGFATPMFSKGGDSGAGLFLMQNGKPTHKLIGVARQPDPDRDLDHFTRVGASFKQWVDTATGGAVPK